MPACRMSNGCSWAAVRQWRAWDAALMPQMSGLPVALCSGHSPSSWGLFDSQRGPGLRRKLSSPWPRCHCWQRQSVGALCSCPLLPNRRVKREHSRVSLGQSSERRDGGRAQGTCGVESSLSPKLTLLFLQEVDAVAEDAPVTAAATPGGAVPDHTLVPRKARSGAWSNLSGTT